MAAFRTALVGCGRVGVIHMESALALPEDMEIVALVDPKDEAMQRFVRMSKSQPVRANVQLYTDYQKMLAEMQPDIVLIATGSALHADQSVLALESGAHVLVEKPMALSTRDVRRMQTAATNTQRLLGVCFQNRFNPPIMDMRRALESKRFGKLCHGVIQLRWHRSQAYYAQSPWRGTWQGDGGALTNQSIHGIDILQWMLGGTAKRVYGLGRRFLHQIEAEDFGTGIVEFANGNVGIIEASVNTYPDNLHERFSLFGDAGTVIIGGLAMNQVETWRFSDAAFHGDPEESVLQVQGANPPSVYGVGHKALFRDFCDAIREGRAPLVDAFEGAKSLDVIFALYESMRTRQAVELPLKEFDLADMVGADLHL